MADPGGRKIAHAQAEMSAAAARPDITERVLRYFEQNAQAMDSLEGIARFWVDEERSVVERCLVDLHARGLLDRRTIAGTAFYSARLDPALPQGIQAGGAADSATAPAEGRGRILVVDDDPAIRELLAGILAAAGHGVSEAADGHRAVEMFRADPHDVVVTDLVMPGISGMEVLRSVRQISPAAEVIVVTAHASLDTAIEALRHGAYDLITKPLEDIESLSRVVQRALEKQRLSAENRLLVESLQARNRELKQTVARLAAVNEIGRATSGLASLGEQCGTLARFVAQHLEASRVSILISEPGSDTMTAVASVGDAEHLVLNSRVRLGEGIAGRVAASQTPLLVPDIERTDFRELASAGRYRTPSFLIAPLLFTPNGHPQRARFGVIAAADKHSGEAFTRQDLDLLTTLSFQVTAAIENARAVKEMEEGYLGALAALVRAFEDSRLQTREHSKRVADLAGCLAREMGLPEHRVDLLLKAAALHELGRLARTAEPSSAGAVGASAPSSAGAWAPADVVATDRILALIPTLRDVRDIIQHSMERFDVALLPFRVERTPIPIESRILAVCEDFIRLTAADGSDAAAIRRGLEVLRAEAGRKHDPDVVAALCRKVEQERRS